ncbi:MAG: hypothetical protein JNJ83_11225 [Verrucomicrobiaceae bacterium]|nr:hypothetical protein [Verrucomicrobiaceae bacterium]
MFNPPEIRVMALFVAALLFLGVFRHCQRQIQTIDLPPESVLQEVKFKNRRTSPKPD